VRIYLLNAETAAILYKRKPSHFTITAYNDWLVGWGFTALSACKLWQYHITGYKKITMVKVC